MANPLHRLNGLKSKTDSRGITGGLVGLLGFGVAASFLSRFLNVDIQKDEIQATYEHGKLIVANVSIWVAIGMSAIGLWGNWVRKAKIAFGDDGKNPLKSRGIVGNLLGFLAGSVAFVTAVTSDWEQISGLVDHVTENWKIIAPSVLGIYGTLEGLWGRWRAKNFVSIESIQDLPPGVL